MDGHVENNVGQFNNKSTGTIKINTSDPTSNYFGRVANYDRFLNEGSILNTVSKVLIKVNLQTKEPFHWLQMQLMVHYEIQIHLSIWVPLLLWEEK